MRSSTRSAVLHADLLLPKMEARRLTDVLIDTDPGTDDALALMMALGSPDLDVLGVTTVGGNATLAHTTRNALRLLEYMGRTDVPVYRGAARPLKGRYHYGYYFHGAAGLGVRLPSPKTPPHPMAAPELIARVASEHRGGLVVVALGPLTNIARALALEPRITGWTKELVVMGGTVEAPGNVTQYAEFNIYNDPVAAGIVLSSGMEITLVPLDVCTQTCFSRGARAWVPGDTRAARLARRVLAGWFRTHPDRERYDLCDPLAMAAVIQPDLLTYRQAEVSVETSDPERLGRTVARYGSGPVRVASEVEADRARALIAGSIAGA